MVLVEYIWHDCHSPSGPQQGFGPKTYFWNKIITFNGNKILIVVSITITMDISIFTIRYFYDVFLDPRGSPLRGNNFSCPRESIDQKPFLS